MHGYAFCVTKTNKQIKKVHVIVYILIDSGDSSCGRTGVCNWSIYIYVYVCVGSVLSIYMAVLCKYLSVYPHNTTQLLTSNY